ncbi:MAG: hypothetical protein A2Y16_04600 [Tenericutes bacterium GWF2_57_13]|nr:MAG: hypothetical protein A2Y16_04600 [Tenericutes bacterium GWF2_57_13]
MLTVFLDHRGATPLYEQIYRHVRASIESGELTEGTRMPSKRELAASLEVSPVTVETAYAQLVAEGYLRSKLRSGHFVNPLGDRLATVPITHAPTATEPEPNAAPAFDLSTNAFDASLFPYTVWTKLIRATLSESPVGLLTAGHPQGSFALRKEIARHLADYRGIHADPGAIVVGAGSEYLTGLLVQLFGRTSLYAVEDPGYPKIARIVASNGGTSVTIPLDLAGLDVERLRGSKADIVHLTPSHQFPTGIVMPIGRRRELLAWANEDRSRYVIEDDYDSEFRFAGSPIPALQGLDGSGRVVYMNSFTKSLAPALRVSYMVLPEALLARFRVDLGHVACTVSNIEQETLARFMREGRFERHLARMRTAYRMRRDALLKAFHASPLERRIAVSNVDAGLHFLMQVDCGKTERELVDAALRAGVRLAGLASYRVVIDPQARPSVVIGYGGIPLDRVDRAVAALALAWE